MRYNVFISYHGGKGDESRSSYPMAEKLYDFLESKKITCFLYKKSNNEDFYDAINEGILESEHFILVARDKDMLSDWVKDEVKQFDSLRKNGMKENCLISALLYGSITEDELFRFNPLFSTKDIVRNEEGIYKLYEMLLEKLSQKNKGIPKNDAPVIPAQAAERTTEIISERFLSNNVLDCKNYSEDYDYNYHCNLLTVRLKCMNEGVFPVHCNNVVEHLFTRLLGAKNPNLMKVSGEPGTQKSYLLQMLYVHLWRNSDKHSFDPIYLHLQAMEDDLFDEGLTAEEYLEQLFGGLHFCEDRIPLFIVDGVLGVVINDNRLDYYLKKYIDRFRNAKLIIGFNSVLSDNRQRLNRSGIARSKYEININLTPISLYDKEKCITYISTIKDLWLTPEELYETLNKSGLLTINEAVVQTIADECEFENNTNINIMDLYESKLLDMLDGDRDMLNRSADIVFEFAYGTSDMNLHDSLCIKILKIISESTIYANCLTAIYFCNQLDRYEATSDISVFQLIFPKTVTRFIVKRVNAYPKYEKSLVSLGERYDEFTALGQSEMTFFLGRIKNPVYRTRAIELLNRFYEAQKKKIREKMINAQSLHLIYDQEDRKQDMFLLRGISVSLIYCGSQLALKEYIDSLLNDDMSNSINRGFHLEYYGDKKYLPNHNLLDYEDNPRVGERTLRILCNSCQNQLSSNKLLPSFSLELFTIASLLQARIEIDKSLISFNLRPYISTCCELITEYLGRREPIDPILKSFFEMVLCDLETYLDQNMHRYSPRRALCDVYLQATDVKRTGWVMQNIDDPESIVEHMYSCFVIGLVFLPNRYPAYPDYSKQKILNMLLVHDLAETTLGDIPKYDKTPDYEPEENAEMLRMLLKGTYVGISALSDYVDAWGAWYARDEENARIAKDIDTIQAIYQFFIYHNQTPEKFDTARVINWLKEIRSVTTELGKQILAELVLENPVFQATIEAYEGKY